MSLLQQIKTFFGLTPAVASTNTPSPSALPPAAQQRDAVFGFLIESLKPFQNEAEAAPSGLQLWIVSQSPAEGELYLVVLWASQPGKFQRELNRHLADQYIQLPPDWSFSYTFVDTLPDCRYQRANLGLTLSQQAQPDHPQRRAQLQTVTGQTEQPVYGLDPDQQTQFSIGRGRTVQLSSGRMRTNDIVFLNPDDPGFDAQRGAGNGAVSRAHATIRYDAQRQRYSLGVDPGGLPASGNKTKIIHPDASVERADLAGVSYPLQNGDQVEFGGEVTLRFEVL